jgi:hypothetical protein
LPDLDDSSYPLAPSSNPDEPLLTLSVAMSEVPTPDPQLLVTSWSLWAVGTTIAIARFVSRRMLFGSFSKFQVDDYLMVIAVACYTGVVVSSNEVAANGSNYVPDGATVGWTQNQIDHAIWGSKMLMVLEECITCGLWIVKACLLILYYRMT